MIMPTIVAWGSLLRIFVDGIMMRMALFGEKNMRSHQSCLGKRHRVVNFTGCKTVR